MNVLIVSRAADYHAGAISWALRQAGVTAEIWIPEAVATTRSLSLRFAALDLPTHDLSSQGGLKEWDYDVVWLRRIGRTDLSQRVAEADRTFAEREFDAFIRDFLALHDGRARWINPLQAHTSAQNKAVQLQAAAAVGFRIPDTLISNNLAVIRHWFSQVGGDIAAKQFLPISWTSERGVAHVRTSRIEQSALDQWRSIEPCPTIFQKFVEKAYELRITVMGDRAFAARLDVTGRGPGQVDWRNTRLGGQTMRVSPWTIPADVHDRVIAFARRMGLEFGCLDCIVTPADEIVFLEVNEMGQFLWIDQECPSLNLFGKFCSFMVHGECDRDGMFPRLADYDSSGEYETFRSAQIDEHGAPRSRWSSEDGNR